MELLNEVRGLDSQGAGYYHAPRGNRLHNGVDLITAPNNSILAHTPGYVTKIGYPYNPTDKRGRGILRYVQITDLAGFLWRYFYVLPTVKKGAFVFIGKKIGIAQDLNGFYPRITPHIHLEIKNGTSGVFINPNKLLMLE